MARHPNAVSWNASRSVRATTWRHKGWQGWRSVALIGTPSLHTPSPECQPHSRNKSARRSGVNRSRRGCGKDAAGILYPRRRVDAVGNVVRGRDVGLVEHVLDLEEEDRALEIVICDVR